MKRYIVGLLIILLFLLSSQGSADMVEDTHKTSLALIKSHWAWAIIGPDRQLTAQSYASPEIWDQLTLAVSDNGMTPIAYAGEKQSTEQHTMGAGYYFPFFEDITGPVWVVEDGFLFEPSHYSTVLLPASCQSDILTLDKTWMSYKDSDDLYDNTGFYNHGYPPANQDDIERTSALYADREVMHSELLTVASNGGRVSLFQFTNTDKGLLILAYI
jgi:hypothetical protein